MTQHSPPGGAIRVEHLDGACHARVDARGSPDGREAPHLEDPIQPGPGPDGARRGLRKLQERRLQLLDALLSKGSAEALVRAPDLLAFDAQVVELSYELDGERMRLWASTRLEHDCIQESAALVEATVQAPKLVPFGRRLNPFEANCSQIRRPGNDGPSARVLSWRMAITYPSKRPTPHASFHSVIHCVLFGCLASCGQGEAPGLPRDIEWRSEHFVYHARAEDPTVCPALLERMERHFEVIHAATGLPWPEGGVIHYYKFLDQDDYESAAGCPEDSSGCARDGNAYAFQPMHEHEPIRGTPAPRAMGS